MFSVQNARFISFVHLFISFLGCFALTRYTEIYWSPFLAEGFVMLI